MKHLKVTLRLLCISTFIWLIPVRSIAQGSILWDRYGAFSGMWSISVSVEPQAIFVTGSSNAQSCPLGYGKWPVRALESFGIDYAAPKMPAGDSELIVSNGGELEAWNVRTNQIRMIWQSPAGIESIDVSNDGSRIAVCTFDTSGVLHLIDRAAGAEIWALPGGESHARFSPDGNLILAPMGTPSPGMPGLCLVDANSGAIIHRYYQFLNTVWGVVWDPVRPGIFAVTHPSDFSGIMDTSGKILATAPMGGGGFSNFLDFSPDGKYVAAVDIGGFDLFNIASGVASFIPVNDNTLGEIAFLNSDTIVAVGNHSVMLFSASLAQYLATLTCGLTFQLDFSRNGKLLLSGAGVTNAATGQPFSDFMGDEGIINSDGSVIVGVSGEGGVGFWSESLDTAIALQKNVTDTDNGACAAISPLDTLFATAVNIWNSTSDPRNAVQLWSTNTRSLVRTFSSTRPVTTLAFSHDGSMLAEVNDQGIIVWRVSDGTELYHISSVGTSIAFLQGDSALFIGGESSVMVEGYVNVYTFATQHLESHQNFAINANRFAVLPDGRTCVGIHRETEDNLFESDSGVQYIDIHSGNVIRSFQTPDSGFVNSVAVNPVTGDVAVGGQDVIVYKALGNDAVSLPKPSTNYLLRAFTANQRITAQIQGTGDLFFYNTLGQCCFTQEAQSGESSITTGVLPTGDYFIVFKPEHGAPAFAKVSLF